jgi:hypothetical protein
MTKLSILLFYIRIFPQTYFRRMVWATMFWLIAFLFAGPLALTFQCKPVSGMWNKMIQSKCLSGNGIAYACAGIVVGLDIVILVLPVMEVLKLHMTLKKKMLVLGMFSLGLL